MNLKYDILVSSLCFQMCQLVPLRLGSPHIAPPPGANDATRGALKWVNEQWPGAHFSEDDEEDAGVRYACVTGRVVTPGGCQIGYMEHNGAVFN